MAHINKPDKEGIDSSKSIPALMQRWSVYRKLILLMITGILAFGCSSPKVARYETMAYKSASPENRLKIEQGKIDVGMSIEECKVSCPECQFLRKFTDTKGDYELWEVTGPGKDLFLHVQSGRIEKISPNTPRRPLPKSGHWDTLTSIRNL